MTHEKNEPEYVEGCGKCKSLQKPLEDHTKQELIDLVRWLNGGCSNERNVVRLRDEAIKLNEKVLDREDLLFRLLRDNGKWQV